jgi:hypothetical protein
LNRLNLRCPDGDQRQAHPAPAGLGTHLVMKTIRPDNTDPIPLRNSSPRMGTIMIRFVGLLLLAIVVLALVWSR